MVRLKKRIEQLLNGKFEYEAPKLLMAPEELEVKVAPGKAVRGTFALAGRDGRKIRGFIYSSNPRMRCEPIEFQGVRAEIHYQADGNGFPEGGREQGFFTICSDIGEYRLPYILTLPEESSKRDLDTKPEEKTEDLSLEGSAGDALAALAKEDFQQAYRSFLRPEFGEALKKEPEKYAWYEALGMTGFSYQTLEEFLCRFGYKETVQLSLDRTEIEIKELSDDSAETVQLIRSGWGFQKITVESDSLFVRPEKKALTADEFIGSTFDLKLVIDPKKMHGGKNYARVVFETPYQKLSVDVCASRETVHPDRQQRRVRNNLQKKLEELYIRFRLKKIDLETWTERSINVIGSYHRAGGEDPYADLFLVQLYFASGKRQRALRLLEALESRKSHFKTPDCYGFYRYLTTFFYQEASYVDQVEEEIRALFYKDKTNWKLQWILFYLQENLLRDGAARYEAAAEQFRYGCRSRILYYEAYQALLENPFLMRHISLFELQVLRFAAKEDVLTVEMVRHLAVLASHYGKYSPQLFQILEAAFEKEPSPELTRAICLQLMKGERRDEKAFVWYARGVAQELRLTGLYEYYMESTPQLDLCRMPQIIRMYFAYDTTLDYRRRAAIYRRIAKRQEEDPQMYRTYRAAMEKFAVDQLEMGRMTEDLAELYRTFIRKENMTRNMTEQLSRLLFTYRFTTDSPRLRSLTVHSERLAEEYSAVFSDGACSIAIYDPDSIVVVEDVDGVRYPADVFCSRKKLFESKEMLEWCVSPEHAGMILFVCAISLEAGLINQKTLPFLVKGCAQQEFSADYRGKLRQTVLHYYTEHLRDESLPGFLEGIDYLDYVKVDKAALITLLAEEGMCKDAFSLLDVYGFEGIPLLQLVRICSRMVLELEFAENTMLLYLCHFCFESGKYDDKLLRYLLLYYEGSIEEMKHLWEAAGSFGLDTMLLEEKIMTMILFTGSGTQGSEPVFEAYARKMGRRKICCAYLNLKAYEYFVKGMATAECIFHYLEKDYAYLKENNRLAEQEEVCRLALLQYYSSQVTLSKKQRGYAAEMLEEFSTKGMRFAFWMRFDEELLRPYQMEGHVFVEYVCDPSHTVTIFFREAGKEGAYRKEVMKNCFEGVFVREFTLFYADEIECYLEEECQGERKRTDQRVLKLSDAGTDGRSGYELINRMIRAQKEQDLQQLEQEMENYLQMGYVTKELFTLQ